MDPIRVLIVDDQRVVLECLRERLEREPDIGVVGEVLNGEDAISAVQRCPPDVVLMDVCMPGMDGLEATQQIVDLAPAIGVVILTADRNERQVFQAIQRGAVGYVVKDANTTELIAAIRTVAGGGALIDPILAVSVLQEFRRIWQEPQPTAEPCLSAREMQVLRLIAAGQHNREIAVALSVAERTVKKAITEIFQKLKVADRTQAASYAIHHRLIDPQDS